MARQITSKGKVWEYTHSIWMLWAFLTVGIFNYISFFYISYRTKQWKWTIWGIVYTLPFTLMMIFVDSKNEALATFVSFLYFVSWIISVVHVIKIRTEYLLRIEALESMEVLMRDTMKKQINKEYNIPERPSKPNPVSGDAEKFFKGVNEQKILLDPVDINLATEQELSAQPAIGLILAKKIVAVRNESGAFSSLEDFGLRLSLKPHILEKMSSHIYISSIKKEEPLHPNSGRVVDF
ncbi:ComEA family DNA-binding protein [Bacillus sp. CHD6a]|uniref:ComEA family DNA-binding protein n=1 Tax=Bacillus sp. CHD6a TaxID=1643452 RepID=UPI0006CD32F6|nr:helix-hairpin-helix domain-containing protein [Bacillus sp. CHD6a]KPB03421.1 hypothetical protein AAV98_17115 [Bacillus sp. CHD6a]